MTESARAGNDLAYLILKTAHGLFHRGPRDLADEERHQVETLARRQHRLESLVLSAPEARDVVVPGATLETAYAEIRGRYPDEADFLNDLADNGLDPASLLESLGRTNRALTRLATQARLAQREGEAAQFEAAGAAQLWAARGDAPA